jgi:hypothetical protein
MNDKWKQLRRNIRITLLVTTLLVAGLSFWLWGAESAGVTFVASLCLALGFWVTEGLVGVMAGVKTANGTAIALLFAAKLAWWGGLFWLARVYPPGTESAIALGMGAFLLSLLSASISHFGWPKISDGKGVGEP